MAAPSPLAAFAPLATLPGVRLLSLQKGDGTDELASPAGERILALGDDYQAGDFAVTAAVVEALDLLIACDTSIAHLGGALGKPVWLAVNAVADWRWLEGRADSPWYPSLRLYRQPRPGDWSAVVAAMAIDLQARVGGVSAEPVGGAVCAICKRTDRKYGAAAQSCNHAQIGLVQHKVAIVDNWNAFGRFLPLTSGRVADAAFFLRGRSLAGASIRAAVEAAAVRSLGPRGRGAGRPNGLGTGCCAGHSPGGEPGTRLYAG